MRRGYGEILDQAPGEDSRLSRRIAGGMSASGEDGDNEREYSPQKEGEAPKPPGIRSCREGMRCFRRQGRISPAAHLKGL